MQQGDQLASSEQQGATLPFPYMRAAGVLNAARLLFKRNCCPSVIQTPPTIVWCCGLEPINKRSMVFALDVFCFAFLAFFQRCVLPTEDPLRWQREGCHHREL